METEVSTAFRIDSKELVVIILDHIQELVDQEIDFEKSDVSISSWGANIVVPGKVELRGAW